MQVSRRERWADAGPGKTVTAAPAIVAKRISTSMHRLGIVLGPGRFLVEWTRPMTAVSGQTRWVNNASKRLRAIKLGRRLGRHVFTTGIKLAVLYASSVAIPKMSTRTECDLGWDAVCAPVMALAAAVLDGRVATNTVKRAWMHGQITVTRALRAMAPAGGATGAFLASLRRVGWKSPSHKAGITLDGTTLRPSD